MLDIMSSMKNDPHGLSQFLRIARERKGLTLRAVEEAAGISNAYLSQLEGGKIRQPSPVVLHKLSQLYGVSYATAMEYAGYPVPGRSTDASEEPLFASRLGPITQEEEEALIEYLEFLRSRRKRGGKR
jgi:transcriptional regulator with XRE-family HTH domain